MDAAARLFAERGLSVPLEEVARVAGVGIATVYRRFPTRSELAAAVFERHAAAYDEVVDAALGEPEPGRAFRALVVGLCELQAGDPGRRAILTTEFPPSSAIEAHAARIEQKVRTVIDRAHRDGSLRPEVGLGDLVVLLLANAGVLEATGRHAPQAWRRFAALMLDALCAGDRAELPAPTPPENLRRSVAMLTGEEPAQPRSVP